MAFGAWQRSLSRPAYSPGGGRPEEEDQRGWKGMRRFGRVALAARKTTTRFGVCARGPLVSWPVLGLWNSPAEGMGPWGGVMGAVFCGRGWLFSVLGFFGEPLSRRRVYHPRVLSTMVRPERADWRIYMRSGGGVTGGSGLRTREG
jgi:hypothetical protein